MRARDVMSTRVLTAAPDETVGEAARRMNDHGISGLPVIGANGTIVGMVTK